MFGLFFFYVIADEYFLGLELKFVILIFKLIFWVTIWIDYLLQTNYIIIVFFLPALLFFALRCPGFYISWIYLAYLIENWTLCFFIVFFNMSFLSLFLFTYLLFVFWILMLFFLLNYKFQCFFGFLIYICFINFLRWILVNKFLIDFISRIIKLINRRFLKNIIFWSFKSFKVFRIYNQRKNILLIIEILITLNLRSVINCIW